MATSDTEATRGTLVAFVGLIPLFIAASDLSTALALGTLYLVAHSVAAAIALLAPQAMGRDAVFIVSFLASCLAVSLGASVVRLVDPLLFEASYQRLFLVAFTAPVLSASRAPASETDRQKAWEQIAIGLAFAIAIMAFGLVREFAASGMVSISGGAMRPGETLLAIVAKPEGALLALGLVAAAVKAMVAVARKVS